MCSRMDNYVLESKPNPRIGYLFGTAEFENLVLANPNSRICLFHVHCGKLSIFGAGQQGDTIPEPNPNRWIC